MSAHDGYTASDPANGQCEAAGCTEPKLFGWLEFCRRHDAQVSCFRSWMWSGRLEDDLAALPQARLR